MASQNSIIMIKKLFTLLTLALLTMPLAWGDFYLTGDFNSWAMADGNYKFTPSTGDGCTIYTLTVTNLPACHFKISNGSTKYGHHESDDVNIVVNFHHNYHDYNYARPIEAGGDFVLQSAGTTTFTFKYTNENPYQLEVTREPKLSFLFNEDADHSSWESTDMTDASTCWTISKIFPENLGTNDQGPVQFYFVDEFGQGWSWVNDNGSDWFWMYPNSLVDGATINMKATSNKFVMKVPGEVVLNVNKDLKTLTVTPSLAVIENSCDPSHTYTVADDMQVVFINSEKNFVIARDLTGTTVNCPSDKVDYMTTVAKEHSGSWQQYNWVMLHFTTTPPTSLSKNCIIKGGSLKGWYNDPYNYTINVDANSTLSVETGTEFTPNVYCPANFGPNTDGVQKGYQVVDGASVGESATVDYWLMTPKRMEVFELSGALWYNDGFYMEKRWHDTDNADKWFNPAGLKGGIGLNTSNNSTDSPSLVNGQSYRFLTVAWYMMIPANAPSYGEPLRGKPYSLEPEPGSTLNAAFSAGALNLTGGNDQIVTGVSEVKTGSEVVSVTYCDLAGRVSQKPFAGVNIIVTRYSDGTVKTTKAIK